MSLREIQFPADLDDDLLRLAAESGVSLCAIVLRACRDLVSGYKPKQENAEFEAWWAPYPKKIGKRAARAKWHSTRRERPPLAEMLEKLAAQVVSRAWRRDGGAYIPNPATYLHQGRWSDDLAALNAGNERTDRELARLKDEYRRKGELLGPGWDRDGSAWREIVGPPER